ncbi:NAD(P)-binding domain-containing protein [Pseudomonas kitaguniensis]|uniref:NAD(P)-binding domain-containing protein n=1 Tax=Pseudomonas kitaguniensis TaxID=2607908 RepID=UPI003D08B038
MLTYKGHVPLSSQLNITFIKLYLLIFDINAQSGRLALSAVSAPMFSKPFVQLSPYFHVHQPLAQPRWPLHAATPAEQWRAVMKISVIGIGIVGRALAARLSVAGHSVVMGIRKPESTLSRVQPETTGLHHSLSGGTTTSTYHYYLFSELEPDEHLRQNGRPQWKCKHTN